MTRNQALMEHLGLSIPLMLAPMALVSGGRLAASVTRAGGLGFITWSLERHAELLDLALARKPRALFLSFGDIAPFAGRIRNAGIPLFAQVQTIDGAREAVAKGADVIVAQSADTAAVIVGKAVDLVHATHPVAWIVARIADDARRLLSAASGRLWPGSEGARQ